MKGEHCSTTAVHTGVPTPTQGARRGSARSPKRKTPLRAYMPVSTLASLLPTLLPQTVTPAPDAQAFVSSVETLCRPRPRGSSDLRCRRTYGNNHAHAAPHPAPWPGGNLRHQLQKPDSRTPRPQAKTSTKFLTHHPGNGGGNEGGGGGHLRRPPGAAVGSRPDRRAHLHASR